MLLDDVESIGYKKKGRPNRGKPPPPQCEETASNQRPGDSVRHISPLHQDCPSESIDNNMVIKAVKR
jgi:hypothetical protein